nr:HAD-IA family hydrolase [Roseburia inulinivorans]
MVWIKETLDELRKRGYMLAIDSSSKNTKKILKQIDLQDYFDTISDGTNIKKSKPDPKDFLKAAEMLGHAPTDCLVVEYAMAGIEAAFKGGFLSAGHSKSDF